MIYSNLIYSSDCFLNIAS